MRVVLAAVALIVGCGGDDDGAGNDGGTDCTPPAGPAGIVYLNRDGATFDVGLESSVDNTTTVVEEETTFEPHPFADGNWNAIVRCFKDGVSPFHIDVVEADPGDVDHTEIVFTTAWSNPGTASISAFSCNAYRRGSAFIFGALFDETDSQPECELALQQFGVVAAGLDHSYECRDYMSYLRSGCDGKEWVDEPLPCGELSERACMCDRDSQNSYQIMLATFGPHCAE
jgi:hypothetical protein